MLGIEYMSLEVVSVGGSKKIATHRSKLNNRLPRMGRVVFGDENSAVHCAVKNFTQDNAVLVMSGWMGLPSNFTLYVEPDSVRAECRVINRKGSNIQVEFTDIEEGVRFRNRA